MFYNFKITFRSLRRNGLYSILNIIGLTVGLTAAILILFWVADELNHDKFYKHSKHIYLVTANVEFNGVENFMSTPTAVSNVAKNQIPGVKNACAVNRSYDLGFLKYKDEKFFGDRYISVDTSFFQIFNTTFIEGSAETAFPDPYSVILTQSLAKKIFGDEPALGKMLIGSNGQNFPDEQYYVSGVVADHPKNSYIQYDAVFSFERSKWKNNWQPWSWDNFLWLEPGADKVDISQKLLEIQHAQYPQVQSKGFILRELSKLHLYDANGKETGMASVRLFFLIALGLLITAGINYINLSTARSHKRNKEIAVRKIMGSSKTDLFWQFMRETFILCLVSIISALALAYVLMPYYNQISGKDVRFDFSNTLVWYISGIILIFIVLLSGIYPALKLSAFNPINAFHQNESSRKQPFTLRKLLVIFQFICVATLIILTIVMNRQFHYIQHKQLGYDKEQVLQVPIFTNIDIRTHYESFKSELERKPTIAGVTASQNSILYAGMNETVRWEGMPDNAILSIAMWGIDPNLANVLDIPLLEGSPFTGGPSDYALCYLNETAVKQMGLTDPIGKKIEIPELKASLTITGVVRDFHYTPLNIPIGPLVMYIPNFYWQIYIKTQSGQTEEGIKASERVWKKYSPDFPLSYQFLDDAFDNMYQAERQKSQLFNGFSIVAILISCLGLFGLVTFTAETKTKEIGIRKVLGADLGDIILMLSKEFFVPIMAAILIAFPLGWYSAQSLLQNFFYRINLSWWIFVSTALITIFLTLLTVSYQAVRSARANPVNAIKTE